MIDPEAVDITNLSAVMESEVIEHIRAAEKDILSAELKLSILYERYDVDERIARSVVRDIASMLTNIRTRLFNRNS